jgi:(1->4)-alpha-D-glucan 1-alpha-D-glucosylmutase
VRHHLAADPNIEYLLWQTLVGGWPIERDRIHRYAEKAAREAKQHTTWTDPDPAYEKELHGFVDGLYDDRELLEQVGRFVADVLEPAATSNVLTQKLVQLAMPGVPDVYQGSERTFLALVDPDNRRPVSFAPTPQDRKWQLTRAILRLRREHQDWFGDYLPLQAGEHLLGFLRGERIAVVGTRFPERLRREGGWRDTEVSLPIGRWRDALTGREHAGGPVRVGDALAELPVALLIRS